MDKQTLSNYGWMVITVLVLAVMLALATPFGEFIAGGFKATYVGFGQVTDKAFGVIGLDTVTPDDNGANEGTQTPDNQETIYTVYHTSLCNTVCTHTNLHSLTSTPDLPAHFIIDEAITNYIDDVEWSNNYVIDEATFKTYALKSFVSISDAQWENVKNYVMDTEYQDCRYENGNFIIKVGGGSGDFDYYDKTVGYTQSGEIINVYHTIQKYTIVENPYNLFNESDYGSYEEYDAAVQNYMTANGINYNSMEDWYYILVDDCHYIITYECEGLTNVKVYAERITSTDAVLETNLKIKSFQKVDSVSGANAVAQPTAVQYHMYSYQVFNHTEDDGEGNTWDVYDYYDFKVYPDAPTVAISYEYNTIPCGCNEFTISNRNITCKCGSFALTEAQLQSDWVGSDYIYE